MTPEQIIALLGVLGTSFLGIGSLINNRKSIKVGVRKNAEDKLNQQFVRTLEALEKHNKILMEENEGLRERVRELEVKIRNCQAAH